MWLPYDFAYANLPEPVFLKRFAAARFVLILGINLSLFTGLVKNHILKVFSRPQFFHFRSLISNNKHKIYKNNWREQKITNSRQKVSVRPYSDYIQVY
jgi:hypothetical protein